MATYIFNIGMLISTAESIFDDIHGKGLAGMALFKRHHLEPIALIKGLMYSDGSRVKMDEPLKPMDIFRGDILIVRQHEIITGEVTNTPFYRITPTNVVLTKIEELLNTEITSIVKERVLTKLDIPTFRHRTDIFIEDIPIFKTSEEVDTFIYGIDSFYRNVIKSEITVEERILYDVTFHAGRLMIVERFDIFKEYAKISLGG